MSGIAVYVQNNGFQKQPGERFDETYARGYQIMIEPWRGPHTSLSAFLDNDKPIGSAHPDYPAMVLTDRVWTKGIGYTDVDLVYWGFRNENDLTANGSDIVQLDDVYELVNVSVPTDVDGEVVDFKYYAPTTTIGWLYSSVTPPTVPRYAGAYLIAGINIQLFDPYPPTYAGTPDTEFDERNIIFRRTRIAPNLWAVVETNQVRIEPDVTKPIKIST